MMENNRPPGIPGERGFVIWFEFYQSLVISSAVGPLSFCWRFERMGSIPPVGMTGKWLTENLWSRLGRVRGRSLDIPDEFLDIRNLFMELGFIYPNFSTGNLDQSWRQSCYRDAQCARYDRRRIGVVDLVLKHLPESALIIRRRISPVRFPVGMNGKQREVRLPRAPYFLSDLVHDSLERRRGGTIHLRQPVADVHVYPRQGYPVFIRIQEKFRLSLALAPLHPINQGQDRPHRALGGTIGGKRDKKPVGGRQGQFRIDRKTRIAIDKNAGLFLIPGALDIGDQIHHPEMHDPPGFIRPRMGRAMDPR